MSLTSMIKKNTTAQVVEESTDAVVENAINENEFTEVDPGYIDDVAMEALTTALLVEHLTNDELQEFVEEGTQLGIVTEKNIVRLDKKSKQERAYKVGILQCAAEANDPIYKKLRTLWKMEAKLYNKLERKYKNKARVRAKEAVKNLRSNGKPKMGAVAGNRAAKNLGGTSSFNQAAGAKK